MRANASPVRRKTPRRAVLSFAAALVAATGLFATMAVPASASTSTAAVAHVQAGKPAPTLGNGDNTMPGMEHGNNSSATSAPGTTHNGAPAALGAPAASDPINGALDPFMKHMQYAHFNKGAGQQVQDISEFDSWAKSHEALVRQMLDYEVGPTSEAGSLPGVGVFLAHMDVAHWNTSPMDQAAAIANFDSWNKSHLAMFRLMLDPAIGRSSTLGTTPGTSVFLQHMDAAHWNESINGQATAITDDFPAWTAAHVGMFQAMAASLASGGH